MPPRPTPLLLWLSGSSGRSSSSNGIAISSQYAGSRRCGGLKARRGTPSRRFAMLSLRAHQDLLLVWCAHAPLPALVHWLCLASAAAGPVVSGGLAYFAPAAAWVDVGRLAEFTTTTADVRGRPLWLRAQRVGVADTRGALSSFPPDARWSARWWWRSRSPRTPAWCRRLQTRHVAVAPRWVSFAELTPCSGSMGAFAKGAGGGRRGAA